MSKTAQQYETIFNAYCRGSNEFFGHIRTRRENPEVDAGRSAARLSPGPLRACPDHQEPLMSSVLPFHPEDWIPPACQIPGTAYVIGDGNSINPAIDRLGTGGFGTVWAATSPNNPNPLAIKFVTPENLDWAWEEFQHGMLIQHAQIVRVWEQLSLSHHAGWLPGAIVMTRHESSLAKVMDNLRAGGHQLPTPIMYRYACQIAGALQFLHEERQLVHRDLKPSNILIRHAQRRLISDPRHLAETGAILADLGVAVPAHQPTSLGLQRDRWKGPELDEDDPTYRSHPAQDIYSFGTILEALRDAAQAKIDSFNQLIADCLQRDPEIRPPARDVVERLRLNMDRFSASHQGRLEYLKAILKDSAQAAGCQRGEITLLDEANNPRYSCPQWLKVVATFGHDIRDLPLRVPADGLCGIAIRDKHPVSLANTDMSPEFQQAIRAPGAIDERYHSTLATKYRRYLRSIKACVKIPILHNNQVIGLMCLHRDHPGPIAQGAVERAFELAQRGAPALLDFLYHQQGPALPEDGVGSFEGFADRMSRREVGNTQQAIDGLVAELLRTAVQHAGAYRGAVRLIAPDDDSTFLVARHFADDSQNRPIDELCDADRCVPLYEPLAAHKAIEEQKTYVIEDTEEKQIQFRPVEPRARSHASFLLQSGTHIIGVLGLDWHDPGAGDREIRGWISRLATRYAILIRAVNADGLDAALEQHIRQYELQTSEEGRRRSLKGLLDVVQRMVGASQGAIFLRNLATGWFHQEASVLHQDRDPAMHYYRVGEGYTGWVAQYNQPLRIANLDDPDERRNLGADFELPPPVWKKKWYDSKDAKQLVGSFMAIPIAVGDEVLGVLRLSSSRPATFGPYDQQIAMKAASRLAGYLHACIQRQRTEARARIARAVADVSTTKELTATIFDVLQTSVGNCNAILCIRDSDHFHGKDTHGPPRFRRLASRAAYSDQLDVPGFEADAINHYVASRGEPMQIDDLSDLEETLPPDVRENLTRFNPTGCYLCIPLLIEGMCRGLLHIHRPDPRTVSQGDLIFLRETAYRIVYGLRSVSRKEEKLWRLRLYEREHELMRDLTSAPFPKAEEDFVQRLVASFVEDVTQAIFDGMCADYTWAWVQHQSNAGMECQVAFSKPARQHLPAEMVPDLAAGLLSYLSSLPIRESGFDVSHLLLDWLDEKCANRIHEDTGIEPESWQAVAFPVQIDKDLSILFVSLFLPPEELLWRRAEVVSDHLATIVPVLGLLRRQFPFAKSAAAWHEESNPTDEHRTPPRH